MPQYRVKFRKWSQSYADVFITVDAESPNAAFDRVKAIQGGGAIATDAEEESEVWGKEEQDSSGFESMCDPAERDVVCLVEQIEGDRYATMHSCHMSFPRKVEERNLVEERIALVGKNPSAKGSVWDTPEGQAVVTNAVFAVFIDDGKPKLPGQLPSETYAEAQDRRARELLGYDMISDLPPCSGSVAVNHANGDIDRIGFISGMIRNVPEDSAVSALFESPAGEGHASSPTPPAYPDAEHCEHNNDGDDICTRCGADLNLSRREGEGISRQRQRLMHLQDRLARLQHTPGAQNAHGMEMNAPHFIHELMGIMAGMIAIMQVDQVERQMCSGSKLTGGAAS